MRFFQLLLLSIVLIVSKVFSFKWMERVSDYVSYIGLNNIEGLFNLGPILVKKNFVYGIVLSVLLTVLHTGFSFTGLLEKIINLD